MVWIKGLCVLLFASWCLPVSLVAASGLSRAYDHLNLVMDRFHQSFGVFTDLGAAGNHFAARCALVRDANDPGDLAGVSFDETMTQNCRSGATCIKNTFTATAIDPMYWGGWYFQNGVLSGCDRQPRCNWGDTPNAGFDLTGATKITFWARGERGGEQIEFFVGGIGRDALTGKPRQPYPDSFPRVPPVGQVTTLTTDWQQYTIDLAGQDLSYVVGGFGWVANASNNPTGLTFYLDDIQYDKARPDDLRFLVSYQTLPVPPNESFDYILQNVAFTYDNVVVLLAYLARGTADDLRRARILAEVLVYAQAHDRFYDDGRLRNAYQGGDLILPPGWTPNNRTGTARLPGWWDAQLQQWLEDAGQVGTSTGNVAWAMLGLLRAYQVFGDTRYLDATKRLGNWVEAHTRDGQGPGGYTGGFERWEPSCGGPGPTQVTWKSTEHNLDLYVVFMTLFDLTGEAAWRERALHAKNFVRVMWGACGADHFSTGTTIDGITPNCAFAPEDVNTWGLMALGEVATYGAGIDWVQTTCRVSESCFRGWPATGIDFNDDRDGIWWEGTAHTVIARRIKGEKTEANALLLNLLLAQHFAPHGNGMGLVAACRDEVTTGIEGFLLFNRLHIAATAWYALAWQRQNPFWGIGISDPIPHEGE